MQWNPSDSDINSEKGIFQELICIQETILEEEIILVSSIQKGVLKCAQSPNHHSHVWHVHTKVVFEDEEGEDVDEYTEQLGEEHEAVPGADGEGHQEELVEDE